MVSKMSHQSPVPFMVLPSGERVPSKERSILPVSAHLVECPQFALPIGKPGQITLSSSAARYENRKNVIPDTRLYSLCSIVLG